ncbi:hypothetical protein [Herbiconiux sp.]|uniref:hypothetical protein n=1 Tax=Herbiconiux sp. TaxID=1871186 RepID=UPI0025B83716|nr:hypothetical protein [Herbiconiux sp.]
MKSVSYAGLSFETADEVADALLRLATALGVKEKAETVEIPIVEEGGVQNVVQLVIGPASQFISRHVESPYADPESDGVVERLDQRTRLLELPRAAAVSPSEYDRFDIDNPA